jgi:hypothetical protein
VRATDEGHVHGDDDADVVPRGAESSDYAREGCAHGRAVVDDMEWERQLVLGFSNGETFVADLRERSPCTCGKRLAIQLGERLRGAEAAAGAADEQDPG